MNLTISGHRISVTPAMREYAEAKLSGVWSRCEKITSIGVRFKFEPQKAPQAPHQVQLVVKVPGHPPIRTKHACDDMYASIDALIKKTERVMVDKVKGRHERHRAQSTGRMSLA